MLDEDSHDSQYGWFDSIKSLKLMRKKQVHYADNTYLRRLKKCEYRQEIGNCLICLDFLSEAVFQISILSRFTHENKRRKSHSNVFVYVISENQMLLLSRPFSNSEHEKGMLQEERIYRLIVRTSNPSLLNSAQSLPDMFILLCIEFKKIPPMSVGMTRNLMGRRWIQIRWTIF